MGAVIKAPITNFLSLADIDAAANQARAAEQQYQLRDLQMKDAVRKQQEELQLRELAKQAYTQGTHDTQEPISEDEVMGLQNLKAMGGQNMDPSIESLDSMSRRVPGTPGGYDREKHADLLRRGGLVERADALEGSGQKLEAGQAKMTAEQMKTIEDSLLNPAAWGKGGLLHKMAPKELKQTFAGEFNEGVATKMHQAFMSAKDKQALDISRGNMAANVTRANKVSSKPSAMRERLDELDLMLENGELSKEEHAAMKKLALVRPASGSQFAEDAAYIRWYKTRWPSIMGMPAPDAPPVDSPQALSQWQEYKQTGGTIQQKTPPAPSSGEVKKSTSTWKGNIYTIGQEVNTPKGKRKIVGFAPDGEPMVDK